MIDIESQVFTKVATEIREAFPNADIQSVTTFTPEKFPCVCVEEADNSALYTSRDTSSNENHARVMYEVNIFSNSAKGAKTECKKLLKIVDETFNRLNFTRIYANGWRMDMAIKHRIIARYQAVVGKDEVIYKI